MLRFLINCREVLLEVIVIAAALAFACYMPQRMSAWLRAVERAINRLAARRQLSLVLVGLFALSTTATLSLLRYVPYPYFSDEFSYLLAADTFASGRLTNPTHPMWVHFESLHIIQRPSYASKYPPAQGLMLALGQEIGGHPIVGVWISMGLAYVATYWMMLTWLPASVALVGILIAALHPAILMSWGWSYWGGAVAMMGGALVFGAGRRIVRRPRLHYTLLLGLGLAVLANSRPFEGLLASLPVAVVLGVWMIRKGHPPLRISIGRIGLPIFAILTLTAVAMAYYNFRVTGHLLHSPYLVHEWTYAVAPMLIWQRPRPEPIYRHQVLRNYHLGAELRPYTDQRTVRGVLRTIKGKGKKLWMFYQGKGRKLWMFYQGKNYFQRDGIVLLPLTIPLLMVPWVIRDHRMRFALITCGVVAVGLLMETWLFVHYAAPITSLIFVIVLQGVRYLRVWRWRGKALGRTLVWSLALIALVSFPKAVIQQTRVIPDEAAWTIARARIMTQLKQQGERHLVIVRYGPLHSSPHEWVYNEADIDSAPVVWAREMDLSHQQKLLKYFKDRNVWILEVDDEQTAVRIAPFSDATHLLNENCQR